MSRAAITPTEPWMAQALGRNLRRKDFLEIQAMTPRGWSVAQLCLQAVLTADLTACALHGGVPVAITTAHEHWPGCWQVGMWASPQWPRVALAMTRHIRKNQLPELLDRGARRFEARSLATHTTAHRWLLRTLGARIEAVLPRHGRQGETFLLFAWYQTGDSPSCA